MKLKKKKKSFCILCDLFMDETIIFYLNRDAGELDSDVSFFAHKLLASLMVGK